jgi:hypothetical protein
MNMGPEMRPFPETALFPVRNFGSGVTISLLFLRCPSGNFTGVAQNILRQFLTPLYYVPAISLNE